MSSTYLTGHKMREVIKRDNYGSITNTHYIIKIMKKSKIKNEY